MRTRIVTLVVLAVLLISGCKKRQGSVEGHVDNLGMIDQSGIAVQVAESGMIVADVVTDGYGDYIISQLEPGDYDLYLRDEDPGLGTHDSLKSSLRVRWRTSPIVSFIVEGGVVSNPDDLTRYTLYEARVSSYDTLSGLVFLFAASKVSPFVAAEDSADFYVSRNGNSGVTFGTSGYQSIVDVGIDSLQVGSAVPSGGYQETYTYADADSCIGKNYVVKSRSGRHAKMHVLDAGVESPSGDTLAYGYVTFLSFYMLTDSTHFPAIPAQ